MIPPNPGITRLKELLGISEVQWYCYGLLSVAFVSRRVRILGRPGEAELGQCSKIGTETRQTSSSNCLKSAPRLYHL